MIEVTTEAIVLDKEDLGEQDSRVFLYTKDLGKVGAKATSLRKITSKLAGHLEPLNYVTARLVSGDSFDGRNFHLADALTISPANLGVDLEKRKKFFNILNYVRLAAPDGVPDSDLWELLYSMSTGKKFYHIHDVLKLSGFDPVFASCELCNKVKPEYFYPKSNFFVCRNCTYNSSVSKKELISV